MENLKNYSNFLFERAGISSAIYKPLKDYFEETDSPNFFIAKKYVASKVDGWELSKEDFNEAKKKFKK
jgi:hypothetical protein